MNKSLKFGGNKVMKKIVLVNVITIVILVAIGLVGFHYYSEATDYVKTENAKVDGEQNC